MSSTPRRAGRRRRSRRAGGRTLRRPDRSRRCPAARATVVRSDSGSSPATPTSGSRNGRLRCTGPVSRRREHPLRQRSPRCPVGLVGNSGVVEPAHRSAVQVELVDRLRRADAPQLRGAVGRGDDHRDVAEPRLDHGRMEVRRCRAAGAQQHRRHAVESQSECDECGDPLVVHHVHRRAPHVRPERPPSGCSATRAPRRHGEPRTGSTRRRTSAQAVALALPIGLPVRGHATRRYEA